MHVTLSRYRYHSTLILSTDLCGWRWDVTKTAWEFWEDFVGSGRETHLLVGHGQKSGKRWPPQWTVVRLESLKSRANRHLGYLPFIGKNRKFRYHHSVLEASGNMGCRLRWCNCCTLCSLSRWFGYTLSSSNNVKFNCGWPEEPAIIIIVIIIIIIIMVFTNS